MASHQKIWPWDLHGEKVISANTAATSFINTALPFQGKLLPPPPHPHPHTHKPLCHWLFTDALHDGWRDVVLVVGLETLQELHVTQQLLGRPPVVLNDLAHASRVRLTLWLDGQHDAHRLHHQLDGRGRVLGRKPSTWISLAPCKSPVCNLLQHYCGRPATARKGVGLLSVDIFSFEGFKGLLCQYLCNRSTFCWNLGSSGTAILACSLRMKSRKM